MRQSAADAGPTGDQNVSRKRHDASAHWRGVLAAVIAVLGIAVVLWLRQPLSEWLWPDTRVQQLRNEAALALQAGELTRADGRGARELYEAAVALDPDRPDTRDGLAKVGQAALARAEAALADGRYRDAHAALQLARELAVPRARADALAQRLRERQLREAGQELLLAQAEAARETGRLDGDEDAALPLYQRVLALQPNHTAALEGREDALADLLQLSEQALQRGALLEAKRLIDRVQAVDPGHYGLPDALAAMSETVRGNLRRADIHLRRGRLPQALALYRSVLDMDPDNAEAAQGRVHVANAYAQRSERHAADFRFTQASATLHEARAIAPDAPTVAAAQQHLARARQSRARLDSEIPVADRRRLVQRLLVEAAAAEARGDLLTPPGASAFDKVRAARAIAPQDQAMLAAAARLLPAAQACFEQALRSNRLNAAKSCLDAVEVLGGDNNPAWRNGRGRLAQRWIAVGDERLGANELQAARGALDAARALDPQADGLSEFDLRVRKASAALD